MKFNADKTEEIILSSKRIKPTYPLLFLGSEKVLIKAEHKYLGLVFDSKLDFSSHIKETIAKARQGISMIRFFF